MKKKKIFVALATISSLVLIIGGLLSCSQKTKSFDYAASKQEKNNLLSKETSIRVFYKEGCPVCQKWQKEIVPVLNSVQQRNKTKVVYAEISKGLPKEVKELFVEGTFDKAKTPYIVFYKEKNVSETGKLIPSFTIRVNSQEKMEKFKKEVLKFTKN